MPREPGTTRPNEHDVVRVKGEQKPGTVVHVYKHHLAYEVEFDRRVMFVDWQDIEAIIWRAEDHYA